VALSGRVLAAAGMADFTWGHVSARDPDGRGLWIKRAGLGLEEVRFEDVQLVDWNGQRIDGSGPVHREVKIHTRILAAKPELGSVVHCHPEHAVAFAATGRELNLFSHTAGPLALGVARYDHARGLVDTDQVASAVADALGERKALLLSGHGVIAVGRTVALAATTAIFLEKACRLQALADRMGGVPEESWSSPAVDYAHTLEDAHLELAWAYLVRRTRARGP